jgi:hypothetical protein
MHACTRNFCLDCNLMTACEITAHPMLIKAQKMRLVMMISMLNNRIVLHI